MHFQGRRKKGRVDSGQPHPLYYPECSRPAPRTRRALRTAPSPGAAATAAERPGLEQVRSSHRLQRSRQVGDSNSEGVKIASCSSVFSCSARSQSVWPASLHPHPSLRLPRGIALEAAGASLEGEQGPAARRIEGGRWPAVGHWAPQRSLLYLCVLRDHDSCAL